VRSVGLTFFLALFALPAASQQPDSREKPFAKLSHTVDEIGRDAGTSASVTAARAHDQTGER